MASNIGLSSLRLQARLRHQAATKKIARLKSQGVYVSGTKEDPRRDLSKIKTYTAKQLNSYISSLDNFTSRSNQYVGDSKGHPIPKSDWARYTQAEARVNKLSESRFNQIADVFLPSSGMTVRQRAKMMASDFPLAGNPSVLDPNRLITRKPKQIKSRDSLNKLTKDLESRLTDSYLSKQRKRAKSEFKKMSSAIMDSELSKMFNSITTKQLDILWNYTAFATSVSLQYEIAQKMLSNKEKDYHGDLSEQANSSAKDLLKWVKTIK